LVSNSARKKIKRSNNNNRQVNQNIDELRENLVGKPAVNRLCLGYEGCGFHRYMIQDATWIDIFIEPKILNAQKDK
jgi:hypothetical protein